MLMPTNELKEPPKSILAAYIGYTSIMETKQKWIQLPHSLFLFAFLYEH